MSAAPGGEAAWGCSSVGRALESHSRGQGFDPPQLHWKAAQRPYWLGSLTIVSFFDPSDPDRQANIAFILIFLGIVAVGGLTIWLFYGGAIQ